METIKATKKDESGFFSKRIVVDELKSTVNERTVRRMFDKYEAKNLLEKDKVGRSVYYKLKEEKK